MKKIFHLNATSITVEIIYDSDEVKLINRKKRAAEAKKEKMQRRQGEKE